MHSLDVKPRRAYLGIDKGNPKMKRRYERHYRTPSISRTSEIATLQIDTGEKYKIHAHLLAHYSTFFRKALNSGMKESTTLHFDLTEHADNTTVPFFVKWVYMNAATESESCVDIHKWTNRQIEWWDMIPIWHFADYVQAVELQNDIITVLHGIARRTDVLCDYDPVEALRLQPLPAESALFRLLAWSLTDMLLRECYTVHDLPDILWGLSIDLHAQVIACFCRYFTKVDILAENGEITMKKGIRKGVIRTISKIPPLEEFLEAVDEG